MYECINIMARSSTFNILLLLSFILMVIIISTNAINQNNIFNNNHDGDDERNNNNNSSNAAVNHQQLKSEDNMEYSNFTIINIDKLVDHIVNIMCTIKISPMLYIYYQENLQTSVVEQLLIQFVQLCWTPVEILR